MKQLLITIAALVLVGCGESQQSTPAPETKPVEPVAEVPAQPPSPVKSQPAEPVAEAEASDISIHKAAKDGNIEAVKQHLDAGADVNAKDGAGRTPLDKAKRGWLRDSPEVIAARKETADPLRKHGGKTGEELKAEGQ